MLIAGGGRICARHEFFVRRGPRLRHILHLLGHSFGLVPVLFNLESYFIQSGDYARPASLVFLEASLIILTCFFDFFLVSELFLIVRISCMTLLL